MNQSSDQGSNNPVNLTSVVDRLGELLSLSEQGEGPLAQQPTGMKAFVRYLLGRLKGFQTNPHLAKCDEHVLVALMVDIYLELRSGTDPETLVARDAIQKGFDERSLPEWNTLSATIHDPQLRAMIWIGKQAGFCGFRVGVAAQTHFSAFAVVRQTFAEMLRQTSGLWEAVRNSGRDFTLPCFGGELMVRVQKQGASQSIVRFTDRAGKQIISFTCYWGQHHSVHVSVVARQEIELLPLLDTMLTFQREWEQASRLSAVS